MCGIVGYESEFLKESHKILLTNLVYQSKIRGLHSFGISYVNKNKITTERFLKYNNNILTKFFTLASTRMIFHSRYSTSGTPKDVKNCQPIVQGDYSIVINGVISMREKEQFEEDFNIKCSTGNDTEILLLKFLEGMPIEDFIKQNFKISVAGIIMTRASLLVFRNNKRPLYEFFYDGGHFIVSTIDIARRAGFNGIIIPVSSIK